MNNSVEQFNFGKALKEYRLSINMSQEELALISELDRTYISMLERNIKTPTLTTLIKISKALSISAITLFSRSLQIDKVIDPNLLNKKEKFKPPFLELQFPAGSLLGTTIILRKKYRLMIILSSIRRKLFSKAPLVTPCLQLYGQGIC